MSSATIDRALAPDRRRLQVRGRSGTKPGSILKRQIPIRTFAEWDDARPGFCEVDLVAHDGGSPWGEFCQTLDLTCVATGWTEPGPFRTRPSGGSMRPSSRSRRSCRSRCSAWTRTTGPSSSTCTCSATAPSGASPSPAHGPTARTTTATSSRRTGPWCAKAWATPATTRPPSSRPWASCTGCFGCT